MDKLLTDILHSLGQILNIPCRVGLIILLILALIETGRVIAAGLYRRKNKSEDHIGLIDKLKACGSPDDMKRVIAESRLVSRQKRTLIKIIDERDSSEGTLTAMAEKLIAEEDAVNDRSMKISSYVTRLGPIFGLMGTLIPLGPGIVALGRGDTETLSQAMEMAFDTTIVGLASSTICFVTLTLRRRWCADSASGLEALMECVLSEVNNDKKQV